MPTCRFCEKDFKIEPCEGVQALFVWIGGCYECYDSAQRENAAKQQAGS